VKIKVNPSLASQIKDHDDPEEFVNSILAAYLHHRFIRKADVAGVVVANRVYRKMSAEAFQTFDVLTNQFQGVAIERKKEGDVIFIPNEDLFDLLEEHQVLLVMKSPRKNPVDIIETDEVFVHAPRGEFS